MTLRLGVIGLGFMGRTHIRAYADAADRGRDIRLTALADPNPARHTPTAHTDGNISDAISEPDFDPDALAITTDPLELLDRNDIDAVSICTPTDTHIELAIHALERGKHVLLEKPVAIRSADVKQLADAAAKFDRICMPAMCMRFWPEWAFIKHAIDDQRYGPVRTASFQRLAARPTWADFYADHTRSGGALFDLHIHDADFIHHCFGPPDDIHAVGTHDHVAAVYHYDNGPECVAAEGAWDHHAGFQFRMRCIVNFEQATLDFDLAREQTLLLCRNDQSSHIECPDETGWNAEVRAFIDAAVNDEPASVTLQDALAVTRMIERTRDARPRP